jgi:hypothetical protein
MLLYICFGHSVYSKWTLGLQSETDESREERWNVRGVLQVGDRASSFSYLFDHCFLTHFLSAYFRPFHPLLRFHSDPSLVVLFPPFAYTEREEDFILEVVGRFLKNLYDDEPRGEKTASEASSPSRNPARDGISEFFFQLRVLRFSENVWRVHVLLQWAYGLASFRPKKNSDVWRYLIARGTREKRHRVTLEVTLRLGRGHDDYCARTEKKEMVQTSSGQSQSALRVSYISIQLASFNPDISFLSQNTWNIWFCHLQQALIHVHMKAPRQTTALTRGHSSSPSTYYSSCFVLTLSPALSLNLAVEEAVCHLGRGRLGRCSALTPLE